MAHCTSLDGAAQGILIGPREAHRQLLLKWGMEIMGFVAVQPSTLGVCSALGSCGPEASSSCLRLSRRRPMMRGLLCGPVGVTGDAASERDVSGRRSFRASRINSRRGRPRLLLGGPWASVAGDRCWATAESCDPRRAHAAGRCYLGGAPLLRSVSVGALLLPFASGSLSAALATACPPRTEQTRVTH